MYLTKTQKETLEFVEAYMAEHKEPPTYKQIEQKFNIGSCAAHFRCRNFRHLLKRNGYKIMTEAEFIEKFKSEGFELYKTELIKPKLAFYHAMNPNG